MKVKVFTKKQGKNKYGVGFTIGVQTFMLDMGSDGVRDRSEANWHKRMLKIALCNLAEEGVNHFDETINKINN